ncbi:MAG: gliding motility-associated C-terminal domain-containing protein, partial [Bacteroidales bacterium]|nr:gliding motility-associated C-terminal domain-containing protein [Bacteroidales bacterium]
PNADYYLWNTGDTTETILVSTSGVYWVKVSNAVCSTRDTTVVIQGDIPVLNMEDTVYICNSSVTLNAAITNVDTYLWNTGDTTETILVSISGIYWVEVSNAQCSARDTVVVIQEKIPEFQIRSTGDLCTDEPMELSVSVENARYLWSTEDTTVKISISSEGTYSVSVLFANGCEASGSIKIVCPCYLWLPNTFTPNGDNINDVFIPVMSSDAHIFRMYIYDRWGSLIFKTETLSAWDGSVNGEVATTGVYHCIVVYSCSNSPDMVFTQKGRVTLVR